jgi:hypothetical protein
MLMSCILACELESLANALTHYPNSFPFTYPIILDTFLFNPYTTLGIQFP